MRLDAQLIAIAESQDWTYSHIAYGKLYGKKKGAREPEPIPDYLTDLNAMATAEDTLDGYMMLKYAVHLRDVTGDEGTAGSFSHIHANAAQRAEAFLKTIGKWDDAK